LRLLVLNPPMLALLFKDTVAPAFRSTQSKCSALIEDTWRDCLVYY
jgi:hypothetical protein